MRVENGKRPGLAKASSSSPSLALNFGKGLERYLIQSIMRATEKTSDNNARREAAVVRTAVVALISKIYVQAFDRCKEAGGTYHSYQI